MKKIAFGENYKNFYNKDSIYVDKTKEIYSLIDYNRVFFSRPRRFGKSTILDTIATLFEKGVDPYFKDTWIYDKWKGKSFYVLRLNFLRYSTTNYQKFCRDFYNDLNDFIKLHFNYTLDFNEPYQCMNSFLKFLNYTEQKIVILIDEYDCQLTATLNNVQLYNEFQQSIRELYSAMKGQESVEFLAITGVTRLKDVSIFSVGSDVNDVTYNHNISTITGFTREEIQKYYSDYIDLAASIENKVAITEVTQEQREIFLDRLAYEYNGYCFDELNQIKVFSTWSVNNFFSWVKKNNLIKYGDYWYDNGGIPSILNNYLKTHDLDIEKLNKEIINVKFNDFANSTSLITMNQNVLMCQTGYLTLNSPVEPGSIINLKIPNYEVRKSLYRLLSYKIFGVESEINNQNRILLESGTVEEIYKILNTFVNSISYDKYPITNESLLRGFIQSFLIGAGLLVSVESQNSKGRSDIQIDFNKRRIILELKYAKSAEEEDKKLYEAVNQIKERNYGNTMPRKEELIRLALVFNDEKREFTSFKNI